MITIFESGQNRVMATAAAIVGAETLARRGGIVFGATTFVLNFGGARESNLLLKV
ncbi:hypothetical protein ACS0TY_009966 [Phlomoides rotata]